MTNLIYLANARMPTEKAHGLQIAQMCEAFAEANCEVTLVVPQRHNTARLRNQDPWEYFGVHPVFKIKRLWTIDIVRFLPRPIQSAGFILQTICFYLSVIAWLRGQPSDVVLYSREIYLHLLLGRTFAGRFRVYEAHRTNHTRFGLWAQEQVLRSSSVVIALTKHLASVLEAQAHRPVLVEHDGVRAARFVNIPSREEARTMLRISPKSFVAGYLGQLQTLGMDKGVGTVVEAFKLCFQDRTNWSGNLLVVGGPEDKAQALRQSWVHSGMPENTFHAPGHVPASDVPTYLAACDVCIMPHPWTEFFAYHTSPLKLFEYMAAGKAILATDMPVFHEVLTAGENALFVPPSDPKAMAQALLRLSDDRKLRDRISANNLEAVKYYTWDARAQRILNEIESRRSSIPLE